VCYHSNPQSLKYLENLIKRTKESNVFVEVAEEVEELFDVIHSFKAISIEPAVFVVSGEDLRQAENRLLEEIHKKCPESLIMVEVNSKNRISLSELDSIHQIYSYFDIQDAQETIWEKLKEALDIFRTNTIVDMQNIESNDRSDEIMDEIDTGVIEVNRDCRVSYMNKRARLFSAKEVGDLFCPKIYNNYEQNCSKCFLDPRNTENSKKRVMYKDQRWAQLVIRVHDNGNRTLSYTEITEFIERERINLLLKEIALKEVDPRNSYELAKTIVLMAKRYVKIHSLQLIQYNDTFPKVIYTIGLSLNTSIMERIRKDDKESGYMEISGQRYRYQQLKNERILIMSYSAQRIGFELIEEFTQGLIEMMASKIRQSEMYYKRALDEQRDELTSAYHRSYFSKALEYLYSERRKKEEVHQIHALAIIDIRNLHNISSIYGKEISDAVLKEISERIIRQIRSHDLVARIAGNEFAILLELSSRDGLDVFLNRLKSGLGTTNDKKTDGISVITGIGVIQDIEEYHSYSELMMEADIVLHEQPSEVIEVAAGIH
ncbi:MAG: GGDEF domain-containing protein, partial [Vallitaleaceae bacterium]|nr:GGDEF domain-containing protein [Vallitaleaceae bacterium]